LYGKIKKHFFGEKCFNPKGGPLSKTPKKKGKKAPRGKKIFFTLMGLKKVFLKKGFNNGWAPPSQKNPPHLFFLAIKIRGNRENPTNWFFSKNKQKKQFFFFPPLNFFFGFFFFEIFYFFK